MLQHCGYTWLLDVRDSPIRAVIGHHCREANQVHWQVDLQYIAAGHEWRRVKSWLRPTLRFCVYGIMPNIRRWQDLEGKCFATGDAEYAAPHAGTLFVETTRWSEPTLCPFDAHRLTFVKRHGNWFAVELSLFSSSLDSKETRSFARAAGALAHQSNWQAAGTTNEPTIYLVEEVPFGLVEVEAPVNVVNPQRYASSRAQTLVGLTDIAACDFSRQTAAAVKNCPAVAANDWRVRLHSGDKWTHFTL